MLKQEIKAELIFTTRIKGNGLCHCVHLEILQEIESEFSKIGVRMTKLCPLEVSEIFRIKDSSNFEFEIRIQTPQQAGREISRP